MVELSESHVYPVVWQDDHLLLIDQRRLPSLYSVVSIHRFEDVLQALKLGIVQGGSAPGIAAAYGLYLGACQLSTQNESAFWERLEAIAEQFIAILPHKAHLCWSVNAVLHRAKALKADVQGLRHAMLTIAQELQAEDLRIAQAIGDYGLGVLPPEPAQLTLYTHCNHGALATSGYGTALGIIRSAWRMNRLAGVYAGETRPDFQGSRLTAWECVQDGIPVTIVTDSMAAHCMQQGLIQGILAGADRIAANGDILNKVGTYGLALAAKAHNIPLIIAASLNTVDFSIATGADLKIRERPVEGMYRIGTETLAPEGVHYYNPASDITPAHLVTAIVTERGAIAPRDLLSLAPN